MSERYISERLMKEVPRSITNFLWYLWEIHCNPNDAEIRFTLQSDGGAGRQNITIISADKTVSQDFGMGINAEIVIRKKDLDYYMSYGD